MADYMTAAVKVAAEYMCARLIGCTPADPPCEGCRSDAEAVVRAAAPIIERAIRESIAARIEQQARDAWEAAQSLGVTDAGGARAYRIAVLIARATA